MASPGDILIVRTNTNEPNNVPPFTDDYLSGLIDAEGVVGASATIWEQKAAKEATSVDVTEAGASHKFSSRFEQARKMAELWRAQAGTEEPQTTVRVKKIERS